MNELIVYVYDLCAFAGAMFLMFVIRQAMNDRHLSRTDLHWVQNARKLAFFSDAAYLLLTVLFQDYWLVNPTVLSVGLVSTGFIVGGIAILGVNIVSLHMRAPPPPNQGYRVNAASDVRKTTR